MLESKAEEEMKQHRRRRHFTGSSIVVAPPSVAPAGASATAVVAVDDVDAAFTALPVKRKRCASACHPLTTPSSSSYSLSTASALPNIHGMNGEIFCVFHTLPA